MIQFMNRNKNLRNYFVPRDSREMEMEMNSMLYRNHALTSIRTNTYLSIVTVGGSRTSTCSATPRTKALSCRSPPSPKQCPLLCKTNFVAYCST
ncbi:hypothetical protein E2C01_035594 [Portunus trituberculatus]|uniref:Uncharacterized protein n=1 Tax=Portunus trituberculatus TaxID=210409 RepID=A0A5B7FA69_PORTR|nr:hypothetical protein [Portunus trituberculatus]